MDDSFVMIFVDCMMMMMMMIVVISKHISAFMQGTCSDMLTRDLWSTLLVVVVSFSKCKQPRGTQQHKPAQRVDHSSHGSWFISSMASIIIIIMLSIHSI